jgi:hypothetical protein
MLFVGQIFLRLELLSDLFMMHDFALKIQTLGCRFGPLVKPLCIESKQHMFSTHLKTHFSANLCASTGIYLKTKLFLNISMVAALEQQIKGKPEIQLRWRLVPYFPRP